MIRPAGLAALLAALFAQASLTWAAPSVEVESRRHDFGVIPEGDFPAHLFILRNGGDETLEILNVKTSCGCTAGRATARKIAPGETGSIEVRYESAGRPGAFDKDITVRTNDPERPVIHLAIAGSVVAPLVTEPRLPAVRADTVTVVYITANPDFTADTVFIREVGHVFPPELSAELTADTDRLWRVDLRLIPGDKPLPRWGTVDLRTNLSGMPAHTLHVRIIE